MKFLGLFGGMVVLFSLAGAAFAEEQAKAPEAKVKYRAGKEVNFEELLIQGQLRRQDIAVVTGEAPAGTDGLVKLRENFLDRIADDFSEEMP